MELTEIPDEQEEARKRHVEKMAKMLADMLLRGERPEGEAKAICDFLGLDWLAGNPYL